MENKRIANNIIRIPTSINGKFFIYWLEFLKPFHNLSTREIDVLAAFLKERYELSIKVKDDDLVDKIAMSEDIKKKVREACNISVPHFQVIVGKLRKAGLIIDNKINKRFIPNISEEDKDFKLMLYFELKND